MLKCFRCINKCSNGGMVDAKDLKSFAFKSVWVRVPLRAQEKSLKGFFCSKWDEKVGETRMCFETGQRLFREAEKSCRRVPT